MLIDNTYFTGQLFLPGRGDVVESSKITQAINQREPEYLELVLGGPLYTAFMAGLLEDPIQQKWVDLRDGANYNYKGVNHRWEGFVNTVKRSPIANYVYYWYTRQGASYSTGTGEVLPRTENGTRTGGNDKGSNAWNTMIKYNLDLYMFLDVNSDDYPEWSKEYYNDRRYRANCGFLYNNSSPVRSLFTRINPLSI